MRIEISFYDNKKLYVYQLVIDKYLEEANLHTVKRNLSMDLKTLDFD